MVNLVLLFLITIPKMVYAWHEPSDLWLCKSKQLFWCLSRLPVKLFPHNTTYFYQILIWPIYQMVKIVKPSKHIWNNFQANHVFLCNAQKKTFSFFHSVQSTTLFLASTGLRITFTYGIIPKVEKKPRLWTFQLESLEIRSGLTQKI